ncbi:radical SAM family heme chaperone HemW [Candidatus Methylacidithermus pantelleriae]|uniref:Heme chaperone HemW n=1 Tax=Candidatus Methylacidithermus pantelleriae TaxID=2744239 RepID=A0A8J2BLM1_9BACT|nr:radical SAM family heme chaperone HemW [Candidatus Methylacidithermus pantelleriae]CAF0689286.1 Heme chaperone HemW [Candidatus Methylacidithermus pantelleriae]
MGKLVIGERGEEAPREGVGPLRAVHRSVQSGDAIRHLYVHVPFCSRVCPFCGFYVHRPVPGLGQRYVEAVVREWERQKEVYRVELETIYLGGGTPSLMPLVFLSRLTHALGAAEVEEVTLEAHPATVTQERLRAWRQMGINRLSLGVQSFDPGELAWLGRPPDPERMLEAVRWARAEGFSNLNLDLLFGLPGQTEKRWRKTLEQAMALEPEHLSVYCLTVEEGTPLEREYREGRFQRDPEREARLWLLAQELLEARGWVGYEISNYARPGWPCRHNQAYWQGRDYLGLGPSAWSTVGDRRWQNVADTQEYIRRLEAGATWVGFEEGIGRETRRKERVVFGLRTAEGIPEELVTPEEAQKLALWEADGLVLHREGRYRLTVRGKLFADELAGELL